MAAKKTTTPTYAIGDVHDFGDVAGFLTLPDGGVSSHRGPVSLTMAGEWKFAPAIGDSVTITVDAPEPAGVSIDPAQAAGK